MATKLFHGRVPNTSGALFTATDKTQIVSAFVTNTTGTSVDLTLWAFSTGAADDTTIVLDTLAITANSTVGLPTLVGAAIASGEALHGLAGTADALTLHISGSA